MTDRTGDLKTNQTGTLESHYGKSCMIDGISYAVPDYVMPYLEKRKDHEVVTFSYTEGTAGRRLTKIMGANTGKPAQPAQSKEPAKVAPTPPQLHHVRVIKVNEIALKYFNLSKDPKIAGERVLVMTPARFGVFTEAGIKEGDEIDILIDAQGYVSLPKKDISPAQDVHLQENLDRMNGPADGETVEPLGGELIKALPKEPDTTPLEKATEAWQGKPGEDMGVDKDREYYWDLVLGGTINLTNYENIKVELTGPACDREQMIAYLKDTLDLFGTGNPATREMIESYKRRVL